MNQTPSDWKKERGGRCPKGKYSVHCYELDSKTRYTFHWTMKQLEMAAMLCTMGALSIIPRMGYFYKFADLKAGMEKLGTMPYWKDCEKLQ